MRFITIAFWLICESVSLCSAETFTWMFHGRLSGAEYRFNVPLGEKDRWDSSSQETPPLAPGKAVQLTRQFVQKVSPQSSEPIHPVMPGDTSPRTAYVTWEIDQVRLLRHVDPAGHEQWVYVVSLYSMISGIGRSGPPDIEVPVRMDGTIPEPVISKGTPNPQGGANGRQPSSLETNRPAAAAAPRRSP